MRTRTLVLLVAAVGGSLVFMPGRAADLFVAGTIGEVYKGDSQSGQFEQFGAACLAPVEGLAIDNVAIYAGDATGAVLRFALATGAHLGTYWVGGGVSDLVMDGNALLVSESSGTIRRVDPATGAVQATLTAPIQVQAMALDGTDLFVAGTVGEIYKGDSQTGNFRQFGAACLGPIQALAIDDTVIYAGDLVGAVLRFQLSDGAHLGTYFVGSDVSAMVMEGSELLVSQSSGTVRRVDPANGTVLDTLTSPIVVQAMQMPAAQAVPVHHGIDLTTWGSLKDHFR